MEKLLSMAKKACGNAEIYSLQLETNSVVYQNARLQNIDTSIQGGICLRVIKEGKIGFAYTKNLQSREELLNNAIASMKGGITVQYEFPFTKDIPKLKTYDSSLEDISSNQIVAECERICGILKSKTNGEINVASSKIIHNVRIMNTSGADISTKSTGYDSFADIIFSGTAAGIGRIFQSKTFEKMPDKMINEIIYLYNRGVKVATPKGGRMKVIFMPGSIFTLAWRILSGTSGKNVYEKISPVAGKTGEKIFSENITVYDDPVNDAYPFGRAFDDEGTKCGKFTLVEKGVLKNFYYDLNYASKLKAVPTGHGYKSAMWGGDAVTLKPMPNVARFTIAPGDKSFDEMVKSIDKGIILEGALGAHSGNIPNGDYSVGVSPALYVEKGEIVGRVKDTMLTGNIYNTLKNVSALGNEVYPSGGGDNVPPILCDDVSVVTNA
jgi:PmbA protein